MTIEDETAVANIIVWPKVFERLRPIVLGARYVAVTGRVQKKVASSTSSPSSWRISRICWRG